MNLIAYIALLIIPLAICLLDNVLQTQRDIKALHRRIDRLRADFEGWRR